MGCEVSCTQTLPTVLRGNKSSREVSASAAVTTWDARRTVLNPASFDLYVVESSDIGINRVFQQGAPDDLHRDKVRGHRSEAKAKLAPGAKQGSDVRRSE